MKNASFRFFIVVSSNFEGCLRKFFSIHNACPLRAGRMASCFSVFISRAVCEDPFRGDRIAGCVLVVRNTSLLPARSCLWPGRTKRFVGRRSRRLYDGMARVVAGLRFDGEARVMQPEVFPAGYSCRKSGFRAELFSDFSDQHTVIRNRDACGDGRTDAVGDLASGSHAAAALHH